MNRVQRHTLLLGGIGGDSHSIGLHVLRQALQATGYQVRYLSIQNRLEELFQQAMFCDAILISSMDGHARHYLSRFPDLLKQHPRQLSHAPLWYLGGNIHIHHSAAYVEEFLGMGFTRVFPKFVDVLTVLDLLERDLSGRQPTAVTLLDEARSLHPDRRATAPPADTTMDSMDFMEQRRGVLQEWKTGSGAEDLLDNARFLTEQPSFARAQALVDAGQQPILIQPRCGVALLPDQLEYFRRFKELGVRVLSYQVDSFTRNRDYAGAEEGLRASRESGTSTLNGAPLINHGVPRLRWATSAIQVPLQARHSTRDPRLLAEISYASGITSFEGGAICYNIPYHKDYPLADAIRHWQYVDRLTGLYHERFGLVLDREFFGVLTATLIPPSLAITVTLIEAILAVQQGVKCVSLGYGEQGNRSQDIAAIRTMRQMAAEVIGHLGYKDVQIHTVFHQYMSAFPEDNAKAEDLIRSSAVTAALAGATRILTKTPVEALRIPSMADNVRGIQLVMRGILEAETFTCDEARIAEEAALIRSEVEDLFDAVLRCGHGSFSKGVVEAFALGTLDIPFAPSIHNRGAVMGARDLNGAVRFASIGGLPFRRELRELHRDRIQDRLRAEGLTSAMQSYLLVERDVLRIPRGHYERWPLDQG